jgi:hypothetical protein
MPRNPNKRSCAYPACRAWAMRGGTLCAAHAGRVRVAKRPPQEIAAAPAPRPQEMRVPTLDEEIALLASRRDWVDEMLQERIKGPECEPKEALRYLAVLTQVGKSLATMLVQRAATSGAGELERFFEAVARRVEELQPGEEEA